jgi:hypothetical protein
VPCLPPFDPASCEIRQSRNQTHSLVGGPLYQQEFWWKLYREAVLEMDDDKLQERVQAAQKAIAGRSSPDARVATEERLALQESREALQILKRDELHNPSDPDH